MFEANHLGGGGGTHHRSGKEDPFLWEGPLLGWSRPRRGSTPNEEAERRDTWQCKGT